MGSSKIVKYRNIVLEQQQKKMVITRPSENSVSHVIGEMSAGEKKNKNKTT